MHRIFRPAVAITAASLLAGALSAGVAGATPPSPPWNTTDPNAAGTLSFFNAGGQQITGGNLADAPLAAYVEGSNALRSGDTKATLFGYLATASSPQGAWSGEKLSASTAYPNASAPGALATAALPVVTGSANDLTIGQLSSAFPNTDTSGDAYTGLYELRLKSSASGLGGTATYDVAYVQISGSTWSVVNPSLSPTSTSTSLTASPSGSQAYGTSIQLTATVSPAVPGTVQFKNGATNVGTPVTVNGSGIATTTTSTLPVGSDSLSAIFTPSTFLNYAGSTGLLSETITPITLVLTPTPTITGSATVGSTLTAVAGTWDAGVTLAYQWNSNGSPISGATSSTYAVQPGDLGNSITVSVTGSAPQASSVTQTSSGSTIGAGTLSTTPTPTISGSATVGNTLTAVPGSWGAGVTLAYQWNSNGSAISGATSSTYAVQPGDNGDTITVSVTGSATGYNSATKTSAGSLIAPGSLTLTPKPTFTGGPAVGNTLTAVPGSWDAGVTLAYQWYLNGAPISGATSSTFTLVQADLNGSIVVKVTGSLAGYTSVTKASSAATVLLKIPVTPTPTFTGTVATGAKLTAVPGTWTKKVKLSYQWLRNGTAIAGATGKTYTLTVADFGQQVSVAVTGTLAGGYLTTTQTSTSSTVAAGTIAKKPKVKFTGAAKPGGTLTASAGAWPAGTTLSYQWLRNGTAISGATSSTYSVKAGDAGASISLTVTGTLTGYNTLAVTSAAKVIKAH